MAKISINGVGTAHDGNVFEFTPKCKRVRSCKMLDAAFDDEENATSKRGPMNMLTLLKDEFTMEDLILVRIKLGKSVDIKSVKAQLSLWRSRKFIDFDDYKTVIKKIKKNK